MDFEHESGRFFKLDANGQLLAEVTYQSIANNTAYAIDHTFVDPSLRGQGIASQLVKSVVDLARTEGKTIQPLCTFAVHEFETKPEYGDIWRRGAAE
ncbi:GNAT family N-acetyltransferase [Lacticaseibacillus brantae]|uniref:Uncharacterized protein n=1 Tax=Lacticaseibacillus brantae DSM 23927 TaxID=1423727 RepID=A0A0R2AXP2_9LACO|nr:GNAT family N-acetyltransferase [Lacticaseibacillus brantae]KRM71466.1 hypothetical protein FC34_GL001580 [Lacticaseibacillus brantae DSM 23927]